MTWVGIFRLSRHAQARQAEFGLTDDDVHKLLTDYETSYSTPDRTGKGHQVCTRQRGRWSAIVDMDDRCVVTILRRQTGRWEH